MVKTISLCTLFLIWLSACSGPAAVEPAAPARHATPTTEQAGLSADHIATLQSLEQVDAYPFYIMHYSGAYEQPQNAINRPQKRDFACSLFAALAEDGDKLYGRNFDWDFSPALLLFMDPPDGYASVSMVDLAFLGIDAETAASLTDLPLEERTALLSAPSMPFDGMNEHGLTIAMAAVPETGENDAGTDPSKPAIGSIGIIREVLDHAQTVDEAIDLFEHHTINFEGGPPIHYLVADPSGKAALIEQYQGELIVLPNEAPWHLATNHLRCTAKGDGGCLRYRTVSEQLTRTRGRLDEATAMQLLSEVAQSHTQWSAVYNMTRREISVAIGKAYEKVFRFPFSP